MANRQVRLDPDVCLLVEEFSYDWDCSLSAAVNRLLRAAVAPEVPSAAVEAPVPARALKEPARVPRGVNPRVNALLRRNAGR